MLAGTVSAIHAEPAFDQVMVQVAIGDTRLLAEVTADAVARLRIAAGVEVYALIKSVSIDVIAARRADDSSRLDRFKSI